MFIFDPCNKWKKKVVLEIKKFCENNSSFNDSHYSYDKDVPYVMLKT